MVNTLFSGDKIQKKEIIMFVLQQFVLILYYPQVYLEQCKYKTKKIKLVDFIDGEVDLSSSDSDGSDD